MTDSSYRKTYISPQYPAESIKVDPIEAAYYERGETRMHVNWHDRPDTACCGLNPRTAGLIIATYVFINSALMILLAALGDLWNPLYVMTLVAGVIGIISGLILLISVLTNNDTGILAWLIIYVLFMFFRAITTGTHLWYAIFGPPEYWRNWSYPFAWTNFWINFLLFPIDFYVICAGLDVLKAVKYNDY